MKENKKQNGITLVALVVTIVVLLILAGITINMLFSDNGIIKQAQEAANRTNEANQKETEGMQNLEDVLNHYANGGTVTPTPTPTTAKDITTLTEIQTENVKAKDEQGNMVTVPKGFKVVISEGTTVQDGIVIEDKEGNQFVWIPVGVVNKKDGTKSNNIQLGRYTFDGTTGVPTPLQLAYTDENPTNYTQIVNIEENEVNNIWEGPYQEVSTYREGVASDRGDGLNATVKDLTKFVESTKANGGYYLARYEASYGSGSTVADYKPLSKVSIANSEVDMDYTKGTLWNYVTQVEASKISINMYKENSEVGVESDLVNSYAWDTAIVYIQEMGNTNYANKTDGNGTLKNTGETGDKVCNIFDMAGNLCEWTTEYSMHTVGRYVYPCTDRGGYYHLSDCTTSFRSNYDATVSYDIISFRPTLYIK